MRKMYGNSRHNFGGWWKQHPEVHKYVKPIPCTKKWVTLKCHYTRYLEVDKNGDYNVHGKTQTVAYNAIMCIDPKSKYAGNIYNGDSHLELQLKFTGLAVMVRPAQTVGMTAYHLLGISTIRAVVDGIKKHKAEKKKQIKKNQPVIKKQQTIKEIAKKVLQSIADIFRSPVYCTLLAGAALVAAIGGVCYQPLHYDCRAFTGYILSKLFRGVRTDWSLSPCMYRLVNITFFEQKKQKLDPEIKYKDPSNPVLVGLANLAKNAPV